MIRTRLDGLLLFIFFLLRFCVIASIGCSHVWPANYIHRYRHRPTYFFIFFLFCSAELFVSVVDYNATGVCGAAMCWCVCGIHCAGKSCLLPIHLFTFDGVRCWYVIDTLRGIHASIEHHTIIIAILIERIFRVELKLFSVNRQHIARCNNGQMPLYEWNFVFSGKLYKNPNAHCKLL